MSGIFLEPSRDSVWEEICIPWQRSTETGCTIGGNKFDLTKWNNDYFERLEKLVAFANERDILVKYNFFTTYFDDHKWREAPLNPLNNVNNYPIMGPHDVYTLGKHQGLLSLQKELIDRVVKQLANYPNIIYEITYDGGPNWVDYQWYGHMTSYLDSVMGNNKKAVSFNVGWLEAPVDTVFPQSTMICYLYTEDSEIWHVKDKGLPVLFGGDSFSPMWDPYNRRHAYRTMFAGAAGYSLIDYTFNTQHPDGNHASYPRPLFGGGFEVRQSIWELKKILESCHFWEFKPNPALITFKNDAYESAVLAYEGEEYLDYINAKPATINYKVVYKGFLKPEKAGVYTIKAKANGTIAFSVGNHQIANNIEFKDQNYTTTIRYNGNEPVPFELSSTFDSYPGETRLFMGVDSLHEEVITSEMLLCTDKKTQGVEATYFTGEKFDQKRVWRIEDKVHHKVVNPSPFFEEDQVLKTPFEMELPAGKYRCEWLNTQTATVVEGFELQHTGGKAVFHTPVFVFDIVLKINKIN
jgi:hypothetical protein